MIATLSFGQIVGIATIVGVLIAAVTLVHQVRSGRKRPVRNEHRDQLAQDASGDLNRMETVLDDVWLAVHELGRGLFKSDRGADVTQALREVGEELHDREARLKVAYAPDDAVTQAFGEASAAALEIFRSLQRIRDLHTDSPRPGDERAEREVDGLFELDRGIIDTQRERFKDARSRYESVAAESA